MRFSSTLLAAAVLFTTPSLSVDGVLDPLGGTRQAQDVVPLITPAPDSTQIRLSTRIRTASRTNNGTIAIHPLPTPTQTPNEAMRKAHEESRHNNVLIGGLMILIVGLLGPLVLWCWIRKRRQQDEAEFAEYMRNRPPTPPSRQFRPRPVEMQSRPVSPSGIPPPPTYQEAIASGKMPEQPK
jgi:hypothetical protein